jgi:hypothetical protein
LFIFTKSDYWIITVRSSFAFGFAVAFGAGVVVVFGGTCGRVVVGAGFCRVPGFEVEGVELFTSDSFVFDASGNEEFVLELLLLSASTTTGAVVAVG